jgi:predicted phage gp36 major capsid-like protein
MKCLGIALALAGAATLAVAKLPPPSDEAKAKAAETAAKAAWTDKVGGYQLCMAMDRVAARYLAEAAKAGKAVQPTPTPACADPGPFVYAPPAANPIEVTKAPAAETVPAKKP